MIELTEQPGGVAFSIRVHAGARKNGVGGEHDGMLKVSVSQAPEKGKANRAVLELLAKTLGLRKSQLELLSGETSPQKRLLARDIPLDELRRRIESLNG